MNDFEELVKLMSRNSPKLIGMAHRESIRRNQHIPDSIKDILVGTGDTQGIVGHMYRLINEIIGCCELAFRRGEDHNTK